MALYPNPPAPVVTTTTTTQAHALPNTGSQHASDAFLGGLAAVALGVALLVAVARGGKRKR